MFDNLRRRPEIVIRLDKKEEWTPDDVANFDTFVTSSLCVTVEKALRNRIVDRTSEAITNVGNVEGERRVARLEELMDILLEWKNLRIDLQQ